MIEPTYSKSPPSTSIDIEGIRKLNWKSGEIRDYFLDSLEAIVEHNNEWKIKQVTDEDHPRKVATIVITDLEDIINYTADKSLDYEEIENECGGDNLIIGKSQESIDTWLLGDEKIRHKLKGVPECCIDGFENSKELKYDAACATQSAKSLDSEGGVKLSNESPLTNTFWNYSGISLLEYTPHSHDCEKSKKIAKKNGALLREIGLSEEADILWEFLSGSVTWEAYHGLAHIRNEYAIGSYTVGNNWLKKTIKFNGEHQEIGTVN